MEKITRKYTLLRTVGRFFSLIFKSLKTWYLTLFYAVIITAASLAFYAVGHSLTNVNYIKSISVSGILLIFFIISCYLYDYYRASFLNGVFKFSDVYKFNKAKMKSVGFFIGYVMCYVISGYFSWKILQKPANPDWWHVEFIYFIVFFLFCLVPIVAMRFSAAVAYYFNEQKFPSLKRLYEVTYGRTYISIVGFLFVMFILAVANLRLTYSISNIILYIGNADYVNRYLTTDSAGISVIITCCVLLLWLFTVLILLFEFGFILCFFEAQRQLIEESEPTKDDEDEKTEEAPATKSAVKKSAAKKKTKDKKKQK